MYSEFFKLYKDLRDKVDKKCTELWNKHEKHMQCKRLCSSCCQAFKILPVEFHAIQEELSNRTVSVNSNVQEGECKFLVNKECSIYEFRPVICRTHGLPLARYNEEAAAYEISYCHLNFNQFRLEDFKSNNVFYEDDSNDEFYELNKTFIKNYMMYKYNFIELIDVNDLNVTK